MDKPGDHSNSSSFQEQEYLSHARCSSVMVVGWRSRPQPAAFQVTHLSCSPRSLSLGGLGGNQDLQALAVPADPSWCPCAAVSRLGGKSPGSGHSESGPHFPLEGSKLVLLTVLLPVLLPCWLGWKVLGVCGQNESAQDSSSLRGSLPSRRRRLSHMMLPSTGSQLSQANQHGPS